MTGSYAWRGGREAMLRFGEADWPTIMILPPLFEEANRTRHFLVEAMRMLAAHRIASVLPDLPGTGDSLIETGDAHWEDWNDAASAIGRLLPSPRLTVAVRGGALLDSAADPEARWRFAPESGSRLLRDMVRATALTAGLKAGEIEHAARAEPTLLAGNLLSPALFTAVEAAHIEEGTNVRTARLEGDAAARDVTLPGSPLWRRAEPGDEPEQRAAMVSDIVEWVARCAGL